ncbi:MAG: tetratricopeptide repeat protein [Cyanobacteria bacterium]|jgi:tetratricopeptide (TPR) repeat protein|nr:tetratricopeptide repeat protein [Cyanobacteria bacterium GSL.Bin21]
MAQESTLKIKRSHSEAVNDEILRGDSLLRSKSYQAALQVFDHVITINPDNSRVYVYAAQALMGLEQWKKALEYINQGLEINGMNPLVHVIAGEIYLHFKNWDEALKHFEQASQLDSRSAGSYFGMGQVFHERQQYDKAIQMFRKALTLDEHYRKAYIALAKSYLAQMGEEDQIILHTQDDNIIFDLIERNAHTFVVEEDDLTKMFGSTTKEELEEQIANLEYIISWLEALHEEFSWQANYIKNAIDS